MKQSPSPSSDDEDYAPVDSVLDVLLNFEKEETGAESTTANKEEKFINVEGTSEGCKNLMFFHDCTVSLVVLRCNVYSIVLLIIL